MFNACLQKDQSTCVSREFICDNLIFAVMCIIILFEIIYVFCFSSSPIVSGSSFFCCTRSFTVEKCCQIVQTREIDLCRFYLELFGENVGFLSNKAITILPKPLNFQQNRVAKALIPVRLLLRGHLF